MALILCIETATKACSVALVSNGEIVDSRLSLIRNAHSTVLNLFIEELIKESGYNYSHLDAVAVSKGPGSYTGLRIGVSTAKGLCYALGIPLIAPDTLACMASGFISNQKDIPDNALFCPMIDARRMEVYTAVYDKNLTPLVQVDALIVDKDFLNQFDVDKPVYYFGEGADKCLDVLSARQNWNLIPDFHNSATYMSKIAIEYFKLSRFEDVAYFEPYYLKDFVAGKPSVKGL